jgi:hypothetical protein
VSDTSPLDREGPTVTVQVPRDRNARLETSLFEEDAVHAEFSISLRTEDFTHAVVDQPFEIWQGGNVIHRGSSDKEDGTIVLKDPKFRPGLYTLYVPKSRTPPSGPPPVREERYEAVIIYRSTARYGKHVLRLPRWNWIVRSLFGPQRAPLRSGGPTGREWMHDTRFCVSKQRALADPKNPNLKVLDVNQNDNHFLDVLNGDGERKAAEFIEREQRAFDQMMAGNMPDFCRDWSRVTTLNGVTVRVMSDFLAIGSNEDYLRVPLSGNTASRIARQWGCLLMTWALVEEAYCYVRDEKPGTNGIPMIAHTMEFTAHRHQNWEEGFRWQDDVVQGVLRCDGKGGDEDKWYGGKPGPEALGKFKPFQANHYGPQVGGLLCHLDNPHPRKLVVGHKKEVIAYPSTGEGLGFRGWFGYDNNFPWRVHPDGSVHEPAAKYRADRPDLRYIASGAHGRGYADYSHGVRLVHPIARYQDEDYEIEKVLKDQDPRPGAKAVKRAVAHAEDTVPWRSIHYPDIFEGRGLKGPRAGWPALWGFGH